MTAERYGDYLVQCPMPGKEGLQPERLSDFMQTEVGKRVLGQALDNVELLLEAGMDEEKAVTIALGPAAVRDESGKIMKAEPQEEVATATSAFATESKKK